jgi:hypothetical protein
MAFGTDTRKSKYGLNMMELNEVRVFDTPTPYSKSLIRRSAHNQNVRSDRYYITRAVGDTIHVTRIR